MDQDSNERKWILINKELSSYLTKEEKEELESLSLDIVTCDKKKYYNLLIEENELIYSI